MPLSKLGWNSGIPFIVKEAYGSFGEQVYLIHTENDLLKTIHDLGHKPFIIQEFIEHSKGRDIRVNVVRRSSHCSDATPFRARLPS